MLAYACAVAAASPLANRYIDLIENAVTGSLHDEAGRCIMGGDRYTCSATTGEDGKPVFAAYNSTLRLLGRDWEPVVRTERDEIKLARIREMTRLGTGHAPAPDVPPSEVPLSADTVCAVCNVRERTHIFAPCGHHLACEPCATRIMDTTRTCPHHDCAKPILMFMRLFPGGYVSPKTPSPDESADDASPHVSTANSMRSANSYGSDMNSSGSDNDGSPEQSRRATPTAELSPPPPPSARAPGH